VENHAFDRAHRIGHQQTVSIMRHTNEGTMMERKQQKLDLCHTVFEEATHHAEGPDLSRKNFKILLE
jgi:SNF2 family DNA or RNA helicase